MSDLPVALPVDLSLVDQTVGTVTDTLPELPTVNVTVGQEYGTANVTTDGSSVQGGGDITVR